MAERVVVGNVYVGNKSPKKVLDWLKELRVMVFIICELGDLWDDLAQRGPLYNSRKDRPRDTAIWFSKNWWGRNVEVTYHKMTRFIERPNTGSPRLWRDRHVVRVRRFKRVWYSVHGNAAISGPDGRWAKNQGAQEWREAMKELREMALKDKAKGRRVKIGGDFNQRPNIDVKLNPAQLFDSLGMKYLNTDVMYLAWDPRRDKLISSRYGGKVPGADSHGTIIAKFKKRRRLRRK